jgi:hypothetical protein
VSSRTEKKIPQESLDKMGPERASSTSALPGSTLVKKFQRRIASMRSKRSRSPSSTTSTLKADDFVPQSLFPNGGNVSEGQMTPRDATRKSFLSSSIPLSYNNVSTEPTNDLDVTMQGMTSFCSERGRSVTDNKSPEVCRP